MGKFIEMAGKKTKKFNNEEGAARFWTYEILTGSDAGKIWRMQAASRLVINWILEKKQKNWHLKVLKVIKKEKPETIKGEFIKNIYITSTMGISFKVGAK